MSGLFWSVSFESLFDLSWYPSYGLYALRLMVRIYYDKYLVVDTLTKMFELI